MLAGHSYGGAVITAAGSAAGNVVGLVYVAAFALDEGESVLDISGRFPGSQLLPALRPATFPGVDGDPGVELYIDRDAFPGCSPPTCRTARPRPRPPRSVPSQPPRLRRNHCAAAWKTTPSWYLIATADQVIPPEAQQFMARRAGAHTTEIRASHAVTLTQPAAVAELIAAAAASAPVRKHVRQPYLNRIVPP